MRIKHLMCAVMVVGITSTWQTVRMLVASNRANSFVLQEWNQPIVNLGHSNDTFSACLLVNDDNHFLTEWLAFHYQRMPLRRLIVAVDPLSRTSPSSILQRWKTLINITVWKDDDFYPIIFRRTFVEFWPHENFNISNTLVSIHRLRQNFFYLECMRTLKDEDEKFKKQDVEAGNVTVSFSNASKWVAFIDVDEFIFPNYDWKFHFLLPTQSHTNNTTLIDILNNLKDYNTLRQPCIGIPRLLVGTKVDDLHDPHRLDITPSKHEQLEKTYHSLFTTNSSTLLTWEWKWHSKLSDTRKNKAGKGVLDISRIPKSDMKIAETNVHRPNCEYCTNEQMWTRNVDSPIVIHHYVGNWEQFSFRQDTRVGRRSNASYLKYKNVEFDTVHPWDSRSWLLEFVDSVGFEKASYLLQDVGKVETEFLPVTSEEETLQRFIDTVFSPGMKNISVQIYKQFGTPNIKTRFT